ncbi:molybdopterin-guanine dinucleotide biosynthesis protein B [Desulfatiferula olefinivorans]
MPRVLSFVGSSNSGKTTLIARLIGELKKRNVRVGVIKHAHHGFDLDREGSDSQTYQRSGADAVMLASPRGMALMRPCPNDADPDRLIGFLSDMDLVIIEGYKRASYPKIEVHRADRGGPFLSGLENLMARVSGDRADSGLPVFDPDDIGGLADFIEATVLS